MSDHVLPEAQRALDRMRVAHDRGTGVRLTAIEVPFSSTVGKSVMFTAPGGAVVAQIAIMVPSAAHDYRETAEAVAAQIIAWSGALV